MTYYFTKKGFEQYNFKIKKLENDLQMLIDNSHYISDDIIISGFSFDSDPIKDEINNIEEILKRNYEKRNNARIIEYPKNVDGRVVLGCKVNILFNNSEKNYDIVAYSEDDPFNGKILYNSPMGKSLIGKKINEVFEVNLPKEKAKIKIINILPLK